MGRLTRSCCERPPMLRAPWQRMCAACQAPVAKPHALQPARPAGHTHADVAMPLQFVLVAHARLRVCGARAGHPERVCAGDRARCARVCREVAGPRREHELRAAVRPRPREGRAAAARLRGAAAAGRRGDAHPPREPQGAPPWASPWLDAMCSPVLAAQPFIVRFRSADIYTVTRVGVRW